MNYNGKPTPLSMPGGCIGVSLFADKFTTYKPGRLGVYLFRSVCGGIMKVMKDFKRQIRRKQICFESTIF